MLAKQLAVGRSKCIHQNAIKETSPPPFRVGIQVDDISRLDEYRFHPIISSLDQIDPNQHRLAIGTGSLDTDRCRRINRIDVARQRDGRHHINLAVAWQHKPNAQLALTPKEYRGRISGRMRKQKRRNFVNKDDFVLISKRDFEEDKVDILHVYRPEAMRKLVKMGHLPDIERVGCGDVKEATTAFEFSDEVEGAPPPEWMRGLDVLVILWDRGFPPGLTMEELAHRVGETWTRESDWVVVLHVPDSLLRPTAVFGGKGQDRYEAEEAGLALSNALARGMKERGVRAQVEALGLELAEELVFLKNRTAYEREQIVSIHDQGAGGNGNVLKEICEPLGATLQVRDIRIDCDQDAVWVKAVPAGPTCHTGARSCFFRRIGPDGLSSVDAAG